METKFNNSDMVGFAKYIQSLYDRGMKPKKEEASSSDLENYRILKSVKLREGKSTLVCRALDKFLRGWIVDNRLVDFYHKPIESKDYTLRTHYNVELSEYELDIFCSETNSSFKFGIMQDGFFREMTDARGTLGMKPL